MYFSEPAACARPPASTMSSLQLDSFNSLASFLAEAHQTLAEEQQYCSSLSTLVSEAEEEEKQRQSKVAELHASIEQLKQRCAQLKLTKASLESSVVGARSSSERAEQALQQQERDLEELRARLRDTTEGLMTKKQHAEARFPAHCIAAAAELRHVHQERQRLLQLRHASLQEGRHRREEAWLLLRGRLVALAAAVVRVQRVDHGPRLSVWQKGHGRMLALKAMDTSLGTTSILHPEKPNSTIPPVLTSKYFNEQPSSRPKNLHVSFKLQEEPRRHTTNSAVGENDGCQDKSDMEVDYSGVSPEVATSLEYLQLGNRRTLTPARTNCVSPSFFQKGPCQLTPTANDSGFSEVTSQSRPASRHTVPHRRHSREDSALENKARRSSSQFSTVSCAGSSPSLTAPASESWKKGAEPTDGAGRWRTCTPDTPAQPRSRSLSRLTLPGLKFRFSSSRAQSVERFSPSTETTGGGTPARAEGNERRGGVVEECNSGSSSISSILPLPSEARGRAGVGQNSLQPVDDIPRQTMATTNSPVLASTTLSHAFTTHPSTVRSSGASSSITSTPISSSSSLAPSSLPQAPLTASSSTLPGTSTVSSSPYFSGLLTSGRSINWRNALTQGRPSSTAGTSTRYMFSKSSTATKECSDEVCERTTAGHNTISSKDSSKLPDAAGLFSINASLGGPPNNSDEIATGALPSVAKDNFEGTKRTCVEEVADCVAFSSGQEQRSLVEMDDDMMDVTEQEIQLLEESYNSFVQQGSPCQQVEDDTAAAMETEEEASVSSLIDVEAGKDLRKNDTPTDTPSDSITSKAGAQHTKRHKFAFKRISEELTSKVTTIAQTSSSTVTTHSDTTISTVIAPTSLFSSTSTAYCSQVYSAGAPPTISQSTSSSSAVNLSTEEMVVVSPHTVAVTKNPSSNVPSMSLTTFSTVSMPSMLKFTTAASSSTSATLPASSYVGCVSSSLAVSAAGMFPSSFALPTCSEPTIGRSTPCLQPAVCSTPQVSEHFLPSAFPKPSCVPLLPAFVSPRTNRLTLACSLPTPEAFASPRSILQTFASPRPARKNCASPLFAPQQPPSQRSRRPSPSTPSSRISIGSFHMTSPRPPLPVTTQSINRLSPMSSRSSSPRNPISSLPRANSPSRLLTASFDYSAPRNVTTSLPSFGPASSAEGVHPSAQNGKATFSLPSSVMSTMVSPSGRAGGSHVNPTIMMSPLLPGRGSPASLLVADGSSFSSSQQRQQPRDHSMFSPLFGSFAGGRSEPNSPAGGSGSGFLLGGVPCHQQQAFSLFGSLIHHNGASSPGAVTSAAAPHPFSLFGDSASNTSLDQASSSPGAATSGTGGFFSFGGGDESGGGGNFFSSLFGGGNDSGEKEDATDPTAAFRIF